MIMLYYSLIYPFLTYGIQVCGLTYPTYLTPVTILQKRVVRLMTFFNPRSHSEPLLKSLRLLKFSDIIYLEILSFVYQWYHKLSPSCFVNYFNPVSSIHPYNTRQSQIDNLFVNSVRTTQYGICSHSYTGPKLWNSLSMILFYHTYQIYVLEMSLQTCFSMSVHIIKSGGSYSEHYF